MKTITLEDLKKPEFYHEGTKYTAIGAANSRLIARDEKGEESQFSVYCEVQVEDDFNPKDLTDAFTYIDRFKEFARQRMIRLHNEYLSTDSPFWKNRESSEIRFDKEYNGDYEVIGFNLFFSYGYGSSGSYQTDHIKLDEIAVSDEAWEAHMKSLKEIQDRLEAENLRVSRQRSIDSKREQFLKLKAEFEPED
jgi:hypothetical protein